MSGFLPLLSDHWLQHLMNLYERWQNLMLTAE
jgi:hypothetical protein